MCFISFQWSVQTHLLKVCKKRPLPLDVFLFIICLCFVSNCTSRIPHGFDSYIHPDRIFVIRKAAIILINLASSFMILVLGIEFKISISASRNFFSAIFFRFQEVMDCFCLQYLIHAFASVLEYFLYYLAVFRILVSSMIKGFRCVTQMKCIPALQLCLNFFLAFQIIVCCYSITHFENSQVIGQRRQ